MNTNLQSNNGEGAAYMLRVPQNPEGKFLLDNIYRTHNGENVDIQRIHEDHKAWLQTEGKHYHRAMEKHDGGYTSIRNLVRGDIIDALWVYLTERTSSPEFGNETRQILATLEAWLKYTRLTQVQLIDALRDFEYDRAIFSKQEERIEEAKRVVCNCITLEAELFGI